MNVMQSIKVLDKAQIYNSKGKSQYFVSLNLSRIQNPTIYRKLGEINNFEVFDFSHWLAFSTSSPTKKKIV